MTVISVEELMQIEQDVLIIDVREKWEFEEQNIGAKNIPLASLPDQLDSLANYKEKDIVVHCQSGRRSNQAQKYLTKQGFCKVRSLDGGIEAYLAQTTK